MTKIRRQLTTVVLLSMLMFNAAAQKQKSQKPVKSGQPVAVKKPKPATSIVPSDPAEDEKKVKDMVAFLGFMLNTLGNSNTSARDKDVLVAESYSKIFRDAKVQVEDDLDEERGVITNKDVVAYLKDINFFFKEAKFEFNIDKVERGVNSDNQTFYKVSLNRNLSGTTSDGKVVNNIAPRFIEVNFDAKDQDLKIVSIYTHEFNEKEALINWWKQLSYEWQSLFRKRFNLADSVGLNDIKKITAIEELDISNNKYIQVFEPLSQLRNLKTLNLTGTNAADLTPIRNLTELIELNLARTSIRDLSPLKYSNNLLKFDINHTEVSDITIVQRMPKLQFLDLSFSNVSDFTPIAGLSELITLNLKSTKLSDLTSVASMSLLGELNISNTYVQNVSPLKDLNNLKTFICDSTRIQSISPMASLDNLKVLQANATLISDLQPLQTLAHLEKVYCDQTLINKDVAEAFMSAHPKALVVYGSSDLKTWWDALTPAWKEVISKAAKINSDPSKEELARVGSVDSINFSGKNFIDIEPLHNLQKLRVVIATNTSIQDLSPLRGHREIKYLNISETQVKDLSALSQFVKLKVLKADQCKINDIDVLQKMKSLEKLYVDGTTINDFNAQDFLHANPKCLLIYKTVHLKRWWRNLSENWKEVFLTQIRDTTRESLHKLVEQEAFHFKEAPVSDLSGLTEFVRLKELHFSGTTMVEVTPVENLKALKSLHASNSPIQKIESLSQLTELEDLDISNTPIEDLTPVWTLQKLRNLNCSGTQIKRLDAVEKLENLEHLDCSNTNVNKLTSLDYLHLKSLKCYNTRISSRSIENFVASHAQCKVVYYR
ncbi:MAG: leucine-rich repeat domain-containing protein [Bacteroidetes bacterium]|nr:leucine-rich repeat domain-containing protein [Bacteroidota bacterium]